jgi:hypothetical protein
MSIRQENAKAESDAALARLIKEHADESAFEIAEVYGFRGQSDEAMHWLERAFAQKDRPIPCPRGFYLWVAWRRPRPS